MAISIGVAVSRKLTPAAEEPTGLLLTEALHHISQNRLIQFFNKPLSAAILMCVYLAFLFFATRLALGVLAGVILGYFGIAILYLLYYARFVYVNKNNKTLCPYCTSRMWQLCCARCKEPVPALAMFMRGLLLAHCPHCGFRLSCGDKALLAWCSTCYKTFDDPAEFYSKPTYLIVWLSRTVPNRIGGGWHKVSLTTDLTLLTLFHRGDQHSASIMCIWKDYRAKDIPLDQRLRDQTRLLLVPMDINELIVSQIKGLFGPSLLIQRVQPMDELWR